MILDEVLQVHVVKNSGIIAFIIEQVSTSLWRGFCEHERIAERLTNEVMSTRSAQRPCLDEQPPRVN